MGNIKFKKILSEGVKKADIKSLEKNAIKLKKLLDGAEKLAKQMQKEADTLYKKSDSTGITDTGHKRKFMDLEYWIGEEFLGDYRLGGAVSGAEGILDDIAEIKKLLDN